MPRCSNGMTFLIGNWLTELGAGQKRGLLASLLTITVMMSLALRSTRLGLVSMIPNVIPLLSLGGLAAALWDPLDSDTFVIAILAIGIGVDTVHFLMRYRRECLRGASLEVAIRRTFDLGRAIVITTLVLGLGFLPMSLSTYYSTQIVGTLLPFTLVMALVADLLLVPAMATLGWLKVELGLPPRLPMGLRPSRSRAAPERTLLIKFAIAATLGFLFLTGTRTGRALVETRLGEDHNAVARKVHAAERLVRSDAATLAQRIDPE